MEITKVLEVLNKHIVKIEEENQILNWELGRIRKEKEQLESRLEEKIDRYEKEINRRWNNDWNYQSKSH